MKICACYKKNNNLFHKWILRLSVCVCVFEPLALPSVWSGSGLDEAIGAPLQLFYNYTHKTRAVELWICGIVWKMTCSVRY